MTIHDDIGKALAAEEHNQGMPIGDDPDHCDRCWDAEIDRKRAECEHQDRDVIEISELCGRQWRICNACGTTLTRGDA